MRNVNSEFRRFSAFVSLFLAAGPFAVAQSDGDMVDDDDHHVSTPAVAPDIREDEIPGKMRRGDLVVVPIPISNPTLDSGLVLVGAYFYPQTEAQEKQQPASVTGAGALYTSNDSTLFSLAHQSYWDEDSWRLGGAIAHADLNLTLLLPTSVGNRDRVDWNIKGDIALAKLSHKVFGNWYAAVSGRWMDIEQSFGLGMAQGEFESVPVSTALDADIISAGLGLAIENDSRDMPLNSYAGHKFELSALFNDEKLGSDNTYQSYKLAYSSYHELSKPIVLAWEIQGCAREGTMPVWDACLIPLRGFSSLDYMGRQSVAGQLEARWRLNFRWGVVGFSGGGYIKDSLFDFRDSTFIRSYGVGLRFMVLQAKRINLRVDYARSNDSDAFHVSIGEAF
jgi:hypothetical protein